MASIHPFRALRPAPEQAAAVSSVPYDVVSTDEARQLAAGNPLSFLHVTRAEIDLPAEHRSLFAAGVREGARELRDTPRHAPLVFDDDAVAVFLSSADGRARADGNCRLLLDGRIRVGRHQEARTDAARQGRRSHAAHGRAARSDGRRVPDLSRRRRPSTRSRAR